MSNEISHFAIQADDVERAVSFYKSVFEWSITAWGPPGFFQIEPESAGIRGAIQARRDFGDSRAGYECTFSVKDLDATAARVRDAGGETLMEKSTIAGVGYLMFFADSEGNRFGVMQYDPAAA